MNANNINFYTMQPCLTGRMSAFFLPQTLVCVPVCTSILIYLPEDGYFPRLLQTDLALWPKNEKRLANLGNRLNAY